MDDDRLPNETEKNVAEVLARFVSQDGPLSVVDCRRIVDFMAADTFHNSAEWKNALMFHISGCDAMCTYKDS